VAVSLNDSKASGVLYKTQTVGDVEVFYREAGPRNAPVILLLHGFPTSSHMFRDLIPALAATYRVIAPDLPGFGQTKAPPRSQFTYSFDGLASVLAGFVNAIGLDRYALYIFDYGAPIGLRLAMRHPERVSAIVTQNGNAYVEGFSKDWAPAASTERLLILVIANLPVAGSASAEAPRKQSGSKPGQLLRSMGRVASASFLKRNSRLA
jgi:pimeloyl-ACP methyl ester carboxylesterase